VKVVQLLNVAGEVVDEIEVEPDVAQAILKVTTLAVVAEPEPEPKAARVTKIDKPKAKR